MPKNDMRSKSIRLVASTILLKLYEIDTSTTSSH